MRELAFNLLYMEEEITKTDSQIASLKGDLTKH